MLVKIDELTGIKKSCVKNLLQMYKMANAGHIASSLSCLDALVYLFFYRMTPQDRFILSKGHAAAALYSVLSRAGHLPEEKLTTFYKDATLLAAHPPCGQGVSGIPFGTGSLGHGLSLAAGIALSTRFSSKTFQVYCLLSDGDCNEGSTWEAVLFAAHHKLNNLTVLVDYNRLQGFGRAQDVLDLEPFDEKWKAFGFDTVVAEQGNSFENLNAAFMAADLNRSAKPKCIIAKTVKGCGVSYMENKMEWHYLPMSDEQYQQALKELCE
jgi:transketolase